MQKSLHTQMTHRSHTMGGFMKARLLRQIMLLALFFMVPFVGSASAADWAANVGGSHVGTGAAAYTLATATDAAGNTYLAGYFSGGIHTVGSVTLTKIGTQDAFIAKLDSSGTVLWAKNLIT